MALRLFVSDEKLKEINNCNTHVDISTNLEIQQGTLILYNHSILKRVHHVITICNKKKAMNILYTQTTYNPKLYNLSNNVEYIIFVIEDA